MTTVSLTKIFKYNNTYEKVSLRSSDFEDNYIVLVLIDKQIIIDQSIGKF